MGATLAGIADGTDVRTARDESGQALFHMVPVDGGTVVTSADDGITPIIAFTDSPTIIETEENPLWAILLSGMTSRRDSLAAARRRASVLPAPARPAPLFAARGAISSEARWAELLSESRSSHPSSLAVPVTNGLPSLSDIRVPPLVKSEWGQSGSKTVFNYYTPSNYVCGCVATAIAQIMRYHRYPTDEVEPISRNCCIDGKPVMMTMKGGRYDWDLMPTVPTSPLTDAQREAIGKLCYDVGVSVYMDWREEASLASSYASGQAFTSVFQYKNAVGYTTLSGKLPYIGDETTARILCSNFDAGLPVVVAIKGHAILSDGYGYEDSLLYVHLNLGWYGNHNAWYHMPDVICMNSEGDVWYESHSFTSVTYNISPDRSGVLLTGRLTDKTGRPVPDADVTARSDRGDSFSVKSGVNGIYAIWLDPGEYEVTAVTARGKGVRPHVDVPDAVSTRYVAEVRNGITSYYFYPDTGKPGNSSGNDIVLDMTLPMPVVIGGDPGHPLSPTDGSGAAFDGNGGFVIRFRAPEQGATYVLQVTEDLSKPFQDLEVRKVSHAEGDLIELVDPSPLPSSRFYRIRIE